MTARKHGGPAFPTPIAVCDGVVCDTDEYAGGELSGLTVLDYFAGIALKRLIYADTGEVHTFDDVAAISEDWAKKAYIIAHAMIRERQNQ